MFRTTRCGLSELVRGGAHEGGQLPVSVYRLTSDQLVAEYLALCERAEQLSPNQHARLYFVNEEMKARGLPAGMPALAVQAQDDVWDGEV